MNDQLLLQARKEYQEKKNLGDKISSYYKDKIKELNLKDFSRIRAYL